MRPSYQSWLPGTANRAGGSSECGIAALYGPFVFSSYARADADGYTSSPPITSTLPRVVGTDSSPSSLVTSSLGWASR